MKNLKYCILCNVILAFFFSVYSSRLLADNENYAELFLASDYIVRGVSYSNEEPVVQVSYTHSHASGVYIGTWLSPVDFGTDAKLEVDAYLGYAHTINNVSLDYGLAYYMYPQESEINYGELYAGASLSNLSAKIWLSNDYSGTGGASQYFELAGSVAILDNLTINAHAGHHLFAEKVGLNDYSDASFGASTTLVKINFSLNVHNSFSDSFGKYGEPRVVLTVSRSLSF